MLPVKSRDQIGLEQSLEMRFELVGEPVGVHLLQSCVVLGLLRFLPALGPLSCLSQYHFRLHHIDVILVLVYPFKGSLNINLVYIVKSHFHYLWAVSHL